MFSTAGMSPVVAGRMANTLSPGGGRRQTDEEGGRGEPVRVALRETGAHSAGVESARQVKHSLHRVERPEVKGVVHGVDEGAEHIGIGLQFTRATVQGGFGVVQVQVAAEDRRRALGHSVNASEDGFGAVPGSVDQQPRDFARAQPDGVFGEVGHVPRPVQARTVVCDVERCDASGACGDAAGVAGGGLHEHVVRRPLFGQRAGLVEVSRGEVAGVRIGDLPACDAFTYDKESAVPVRDCGLFQHRP